MTVDSGSSDSTGNKGETLMQYLAREGGVRLKTSDLEWRSKLGELFQRGIAESKVHREVFPSKEENKRPMAEKISDAYLRVGKGAVSTEDHKRFFNMVEEALANAIRDGNKLDGNKHVTIVYGIFIAGGKRKFGVYIEDEGAGFVLDTVSSPFTDEGLLRESGRGLLIMNERLAILKGLARFFPMHAETNRCREVFIEVPLPDLPA